MATVMCSTALSSDSVHHAGSAQESLFHCHQRKRSVQLAMSTAMASTTSCALGQNAIHVLRGSASGLSLALQIPISAAAIETVDIAAGDINGDGRTDVILAAARDAEGEKPQHISVTVYLGGSTTSPRRISWTEQKLPRPSFFHVEVADINGDGNDDVVVAVESRRSSVRVVLGDPRTIRLLPASIPAFDAVGPLEGIASIGDTNGDGFDDLLVLTSSYADPNLRISRLFFGGAVPLATKPKVFTQGTYDPVPVAAPD